MAGQAALGTLRRSEDLSLDTGPERGQRQDAAQPSARHLQQGGPQAALALGSCPSQPPTQSGGLPVECAQVDSPPCSQTPLDGRLLAAQDTEPLQSPRAFLR